MAQPRGILPIPARGADGTVLQRRFRGFHSGVNMHFTCFYVRRVTLLDPNHFLCGICRVAVLIAILFKDFLVRHTFFLLSVLLLPFTGFQSQECLLSLL